MLSEELTTEKIYETLGINAEGIKPLQKTFQAMADNLGVKVDDYLPWRPLECVAGIFAEHDPKLSRIEESTWSSRPLSINSLADMGLLFTQQKIAESDVERFLRFLRTGSPAQKRVLDKDIHSLTAADIRTLTTPTPSQKNFFMFEQGQTVALALQIVAVKAVLAVKGYTKKETRNLLIEGLPDAAVETFQRAATVAQRNDAAFLNRFKAFVDEYDKK